MSARLVGAGFKTVRPLRPDYCVRLNSANLRKVALAIKGTVMTLDSGEEVLFADDPEGMPMEGRVGDFVVYLPSYSRPVIQILSERDYVNRYGPAIGL